METIGIVAAMSSECKAILRLVKRSDQFKLGQFRCYGFELSGRNCLMIKSGVGVKRAMDAATALIAHARPQLLVSFGVAGAAIEELIVGDVVVASQTFLLDNCGESMFHRLPPLTDEAWLSAKQVLVQRGARLAYGTIVTTRMSNASRGLRPELENPAFDMETAGIAQVASAHGTAVIALRAMSDGPLEPLSFDIEEMTDEDFNMYILKAARMVLKQPRLALGSVRIVKNVRKAGDNAAASLEAVLGQSGILKG